MKTFKLSIFLILVATVAFGQNFPSGKTILDKVDNNMSAKTRILTASMEVGTERTKRTMVSKTYGEGDHKAYTEYLAPAREKGTKMLKLDNQLWIYSPSTDRTVQISGHMLRQSVMGSDMSYEDMMNDKPLLEQYKAEVTGTESIEGTNCWVVTLTAIIPDVNYYTRKMWVDTERFVPLKEDMFAKSGKLLKRITFSNVQKVQGRWFPLSFVYKDMLKEGPGTKMTIQEIQLDTAIPANYFNLGSLK
ncbi:MAG TPA: outer membrane lipoprotein-sorting protein [Prolixibacteraceae bacterium]|jgi:outer membrane lipoprotein-sorting protein|nr:outer membrane lipoprotein-sorting protein [Prolixibacteraceae bacterium]